MKYCKYVGSKKSLPKTANDSLAPKCQNAERTEERFFPLNSKKYCFWSDMIRLLRSKKIRFLWSKLASLPVRYLAFEFAHSWGFSRPTTTWGGFNNCRLQFAMFKLDMFVLLTCKWPVPRNGFWTVCWNMTCARVILDRQTQTATLWFGSKDDSRPYMEKKTTFWLIQKIATNKNSIVFLHASRPCVDDASVHAVLIWGEWNYIFHSEWLTELR